MHKIFLFSYNNIIHYVYLKYKKMEKNIYNNLLNYYIKLMDFLSKYLKYEIKKKKIVCIYFHTNYVYNRYVKHKCIYIIAIS